MRDFMTFRVVDAFAETPFSGNPAGVVLGADHLTAAQMQMIAREVNLSETAFVSRMDSPAGPPQVRWFTPSTEVGFCGHATLGAAHALSEKMAEQVAPAKGLELSFDSAAGLLTLRAERVPGRAESLLWWLHMPAPQLRPANINPMRTCDYLGLRHDELDADIPIMRTRDDDLIVIMRGWQRLMEIRPRMDDLAEWSRRHDVRGILVSTVETLSPAIQVCSRFFAPAAGVPEDPVTGSVHGPLAALLVEHGRVLMTEGRAAIVCLQGAPGDRTGLVRALVERKGEMLAVAIAGHCQTIVRGEIRIPVMQEESRFQAS